MTPLSNKLYEARVNAKLNQTELSERVGVTRRSIFSYENGTSVPRNNVLHKLSEVLGVSEFYLTHDDCDDPNEGRTREESIRMAREKFGSKGAREAAELLDRNSAFFAGGDIPQEDKDAFFEALMTAYVTAKTEAKNKFTPKSVKAAANKKK